MSSSLPQQQGRNAPEGGVETLVVFDFDGTLFRSPAPHPALNSPQNPDYVSDFIQRPTFTGGLGWFQNLATLSPPFVPETPDIERWYVSSMLQAFDTHKRSGAAHIVVMTGRDEWFRARVEHLVAAAGLRPDEVILKPHGRAGTVAYKSENLRRLLEAVRPRHVILYDDRPVQLEALRTALSCLQQQLTGVEAKEPPAPGANRAAAAVRFADVQNLRAKGFTQFSFEVQSPPECPHTDTHLSAEAENELLHLLASAARARPDASNNGRDTRNRRNLEGGGGHERASTNRRRME